MSKLEPEFVAVHAMLCDQFDSKLGEWIDLIKETGAKPAASTHTLGTTISLLDSSGFEAYLAPLNPIGYGMQPDFESTLRAIENTRKLVIVIKPLAAGKIIPERAVFEFIYKYADSIAVGVTSEDEMAETYSAALIEALYKPNTLAIFFALPDKCPRLHSGCDIQNRPECESMQEYIYCEHFYDGRWRKEARIVAVCSLKSKFGN